MLSTKAAGPAPLGAVAHSATQLRTLETALLLFTRDGVAGTSLQRIADELGVTKAAVYHQFKTKEEIILGAAELVLTPLETVVARAETERTQAHARDVLITGLIALAVERRRVVSVLQRDPVMVRFLEEHAPFRKVMERLYRVLMSDDLGAEQRVSAAMMSAAIAGAVIHPLVANLDDAALRRQLLRFARRFLGLPK